MAARSTGAGGGYEYNVDDLGDIFGDLGGMFGGSREHGPARREARISRRRWISISLTPCVGFRLPDTAAACRVRNLSRRWEQTGKHADDMPRVGRQR